MMKSEFIERTGFEPTASEYEEIEAEYTACDTDKDQFCKEWKKNGGATRLMRRRATKIEELEAENKQRAREYGELDKIRVEGLEREQNIRKAQAKEMQRQIDDLKLSLTQQEAEADDWMKRAKEAERQLTVLKEAMQILGIVAAEA